MREHDKVREICRQMSTEADNRRLYILIEELRQLLAEPRNRTFAAKKAASNGAE
jgi:hypothetical protein